MPELDKRNIEIEHMSPEQRAELLAKLTAEAAEKKPELKVKSVGESPKESIPVLAPEQAIAASTNIPTDISMEKRVEMIDPKIAQQRLEALLNSDEKFDPNDITNELYS